jgi:uncharacterized protein
MKLNFLLLSLLTLFCLITTSGFSQTGFTETGIFMDTIKFGGNELRIALTIQKTDDGKHSASFNSIDQGSGEIAFDEINIAGSYILLKSRVGIEIEGNYNDDYSKIIAEFRQGPAKFPMEYERIDKIPIIFNRPQEPKKPFPYIEEEVLYSNEKAGVQLAGTLTLPQGEGPFPAVLLLTGSGPQNRDEELVGHKPFLVIADYLTRQGIAVLRVDDRGIGGSTGDFKNSTTGDFAEDALAGVDFLKSRKEINSSKIGLIGHSEGGISAPIAANNSGDIAFIVLLAGPGANLGDVVNYQRLAMSRKSGATEEYLKVQEKVLVAINEIARKEITDDEVREEVVQFYAGLSDEEKSILNWSDDRVKGTADLVLGNWWRYGLRHNPKEALQSLKIPVLALLGEKDQQVPVALNQKELESALIRGHEKSQVVVMPGLNHLFQTSETGDVTEYIKIEETMSPAVLELVTGWIKNL